MHVEHIFGKKCTYYVSLFYLFNLVHAAGMFLYLLKTSETKGSLTFSGSIERDNWHQTG